MVRRQFIYIFTLTLLITSCSIHSKKYQKKYKDRNESCQLNWTYDDLTSKTELRVLLFEKKWSFDTAFSPNFVIGITSNLDTIGIIDIHFSGTVKKDDVISVLPTPRTANEIRLYTPSLPVYKTKKDNDLICSVKTVYYGRIENK